MKRAPAGKAPASPRSRAHSAKAGKSWRPRQPGQPAGAELARCRQLGPRASLSEGGRQWTMLSGQVAVELGDRSLDLVSLLARCPMLAGLVAVGSGQCWLGADCAL
jgi:hypothetical protein